MNLSMLVYVLTHYRVIGATFWHSFNRLSTQAHTHTLPYEAQLIHLKPLFMASIFCIIRCLPLCGSVEKASIIASFSGGVCFWPT